MILAYTITFKCVGTDAPNAHHFPKRQSPLLPIQCFVVVSNWLNNLRKIVNELETLTAVGGVGGGEGCY